MVIKPTILWLKSQRIDQQITFLANRMLSAISKDYAAVADEMDGEQYKKENKLSSWARLLPVLHFHLVGWRNGLNPAPLFDTGWYLDTYDDVKRAGVNPFAHFLRHGHHDRRDPSAAFDTTWYLARNADVVAASINPLVHYWRHGREEGRAPRPARIMQALHEDLTLVLRGGRSTYVSAQWSVRLSDFESKRITQGNDDWSVSPGNDPQLVLKRTIEAGFIKIQLRGRVAHLRDGAAGEACCEVFFDLGRGYLQDYAFTYQVTDATIDIDETVFIESDVHRIRIDPINTDCHFIFDEFLIEAMPLEDAIIALYRTYCWGDAPRSDRHFSNEMKWSSIATFVRRQGRSIDKGVPAYERWMQTRRISPDQWHVLREAFGRRGPIISILMPTYKSDLVYLKAAIDSVRVQIYENWQLVIVDDGSNEPALRDFLDGQTHLDPRIHVDYLDRNGGISAATNRALSMAAGEFIALLDHDDELAPHALLMMARAIDANPTADMLYSDEDKIDIDGERRHPLFKPDWSPEFFMSCMYTCHLGVYRRALVEDVGGFRSAFDFAQDYDLAFRVSARARTIVHVPDILYHWRILPSSTAGGADAKPTAEHAARRAVQDHLDATGLQGIALPGPFAGSHRVQLKLIGEPSISIVIPTAARRIQSSEERWYLLDLLRSIRDKSTYRNFEIVIVHNGDIEPKLASALADYDLVQVHYNEPVFNYPEKANLGVRTAQNDYVILLNDDMTIITPGWMEEMVSWLQRPGIAAVGGKLLFPDDTVQHAGILLLGQGPSHVYYGAADGDAGLIGSALLIRNYAAVTGACCAVSRENYLAVGGYDPAFRVNYNDVDFCLKLSRLGRIVYTPYAKFHHYESVSRDESPDSELPRFNLKWSRIVGADPYYNINYSQSVANDVTLFPNKMS